MFDVCGKASVRKGKKRVLTIKWVKRTPESHSYTADAKHTADEWIGVNRNGKKKRKLNDFISMNGFIVKRGMTSGGA